MLGQLAAAGILRTASDPQVLAAFLMVNDLAVLLLRDHLTAGLGVDPLSPDGAARWAQTVIAVYRDGIFIPPPPTSREDR